MEGQNEHNLNRLIHEKRDEILRLAARHGAYNVRVFGSAARGEAGPDSDLDFLVNVGPQRTPFFPGGLLADLGELRAAKGISSRSMVYPGTGAAGSGASMTIKDDTLYHIHISEESVGPDERVRREARQNFWSLIWCSMLFCAASRLWPNPVKGDINSHPDIPWKDIIGLRNVLVHDYLAVDVEEIWKIVELDLRFGQIAFIRSQTGGR